jgi:hypothetical protein
MTGVVGRVVTPVGHDLHMTIDWSATAAISALLLFVVTAWQVTILRSQVKQGQDAVAEAAKAAIAAERAVTEATRARIDARASHVVAFISKPHWPPYLNNNRAADQWGRLFPLDPIKHEPMKPETPFWFPSSSEKYLWFDNEITLKNEGLTTAQVEISDGDVQLSDSIRLSDFVSQDDVQRIGGSPGSNRYALPPGQTMRLDWRTGRTLQEWKLAYDEPDPPNPLGACLAGITVVDEDHEGVVDSISFLIGGRPIEPVDGQNGQWQLATTDAGKFIATVVSRRRRYRVDGVLSSLTPSEQEIQFQAWEALAQKGERTRP